MLLNFRQITVEPALLVYTTAVQITTLVDVNLLLQKACHSDASCEDETSAQKIITDINTWKPILDSCLASVFIIFIGQWSDTHGKRRKPMLIFPIVGEVICLLLLLFSVYFWKLSPELTAILTACRSLTGGFACFTAGCLTYISDITSEEDRTPRVALMESMMLAAFPMGSALAGLSRSRLNFYGTYAVCIIMNVVALILVTCLMKNSAIQKTELKMCEGVFYPKNIIENLMTLVKKRQDSRRLMVILTFLVTPLFNASTSGEKSVFYLYARYKFNMNEEEYDYFVSYRNLVSIAGVIPIIIIFVKLYKASDAVFGLSGSVAMFISGVLCSLVQKEWQLMALSLLEPMRGVVTITSRSLLTKVIDSNELGRITGLQSALQTFIPTITIPVYSNFYKITFGFLEGAFFILNSCIGTILFTFFVIIVLIQRKENKINVVLTTRDAE